MRLSGWAPLCSSDWGLNTTISAAEYAVSAAGYVQQSLWLDTAISVARSNDLCGTCASRAQVLVWEPAGRLCAFVPGQPELADHPVRSLILLIFAQLLACCDAHPDIRMYRESHRESYRALWRTSRSTGCPLCIIKDTADRPDYFILYDGDLICQVSVPTRLQAMCGYYLYSFI